MPLFPIPGSSRDLHKPLCTVDFSNVIVAAMKRRMTGAYKITGQEWIDYIDLIQEMKRETQARGPIVRIAYQMFALLLCIYDLFSKNPPFTEKQLKAVSTRDVFD